MFTAYIVGDRELIARLGTLPPQVRNSLSRAIGKLGLDLQRRVMGKLSGPVLKMRTGTLHSSINFSGPRETATGIIGSVGTKVKYGKYHEFGVPRSWLITAKAGHALRFQVGGRTIFRKSVMHRPLPERSFLRSALREMAPQIRADLDQAVRGTVGERVHR